ncbi:MAG: hypothetical protein GX886_16100 [Comamonadaceae bacterium]|nr:hypothetical protein [Rubrivivax sp.]NLZ42742.1 hypothetical protein [Comamonadaceae bacterium]
MRAWVLAHRWLCGLVAAVLLFGQTAGAVYACEPRDGALDRETTAAPEDCRAHRAAAAEQNAGGERALLCKAHCQAGEQSVNSGSSAGDVPHAALIAVVLWPLQGAPGAGALASPRPERPALGPPAGTPPLFITLQVLRN